VLSALGIDTISALVPVTGGWDAAIWRVEHGGRVSALRVFQPDQSLQARHEALVMRLARATAPVPGIRAEGVWQERPAMLIEWCSGRTVEAELRARPWRARALGRAFGQAQAAIHAAPTGHELNDLAGRWLLAAGPDEDALRRRLRAVAGPDRLLHLDYHPLNVMTAGERITGVLDWANALPGDPRADLARTFSILRLMSGVPDRLRLWERATLALFQRGWLAGYRSEAGPPHNMEVFYAWAGALMQRDLAPRVGRPDTGLTQAHMATIRDWTERWKHQAGLGA
jgi:aminoglycoside phosphotransferase (APT) family kinase protein